MAEGTFDFTKRSSRDHKRTLGRMTGEARLDANTSTNVQSCRLCSFGKMGESLAQQRHAFGSYLLLLSKATDFGSIAKQKAGGQRFTSHSFTLFAMGNSVKLVFPGDGQNFWISR